MLNPVVNYGVKLCFCHFHYCALDEVHFQPETVRELRLLDFHQMISSGADLEARDNSGRTVLIWGATNDRGEVIVPLLGHTSLVNAMDGEGETALMIASWYGCTSAVKALLKKGADVNATTCHNK